MPEARITVGNVEIVALTDLEVDFPYPLSQLFPSVSAADWQPFQQRYAAAFSGPDTWHNHFGCYLLRSQGQTILVDTGVGSNTTNPGMVGALGGQDGGLMTELASLGVKPEDVNTVFFTHLHPDHVGWNLKEAGGSQLQFANARYLAHQADWDTFGNPEVQEQLPMSFWQETLAPLESSGALELISAEEALTTEITAVPTPGHTPGHMSLAIVSGGQHSLILGDVAVHPAQLTNVDWTFIFEMDPEQAISTRQEVFDRAEAQNALVAACHFPEPGFGHLVRVQGRRYWQGI